MEINSTLSYSILFYLFYGHIMITLKNLLYLAIVWAQIFPPFQNLIRWGNSLLPFYSPQFLTLSIGTMLLFCIVKNFQALNISDGKNVVTETISLDVIFRYVVKLDINWPFNNQVEEKIPNSQLGRI